MGPFLLSVFRSGSVEGGEGFNVGWSFRSVHYRVLLGGGFMVSVPRKLREP